MIKIHIVQNEAGEIVAITIHESDEHAIILDNTDGKRLYEVLKPYYDPPEGIGNV